MVYRLDYSMTTMLLAQFPGSPDYSLAGPTVRFLRPPGTPTYTTFYPPQYYGPVPSPYYAVTATGVVLTRFGSTPTTTGLHNAVPCGSTV